MEYITNGVKFHFSYQDLKDKYNNFKNMSNKDFKKNLVKAAHLACIICFIKEETNNNTIGDKGIVHELIHLMQFPDEPLINLEQIREQFNNLLYLA